MRARTFRSASIASVAWALALLAAPVATSFNLRWDDPAAPGQHPFVEGFLTSREGRLGIAWDAAATSQDNIPARGPDDPVEDEKFKLERHLNSPRAFCQGEPIDLTDPCSPTYPATAGTRLAKAPPPADDFVGEPLPARVILNVTRGFMLTLYLQAHPDHAKPCTEKSDTRNVGGALHSTVSWLEPSLDVELFANGTLVGGGVATDPARVVWWYMQPSKARPPDPAGYGTCFYQMHPEVPVLEAGTVLTLRIIHQRQLHEYPYGLAGDHRSSIRIWAYPPDDVLFRRPDLLLRLASEPGDEGPEADTVGDVFLPALLGVAGFLGRGPRRRALLVALLGASALLAGCAGGGGGAREGGGGQGPRGEVENTLFRDEGGSPTTATGSIRGEVHDDLHIPVAGVHVSVLGASFFDTTESRGRFTFTGVPAGLHRLRFDHADYHGFEADVEVKAGFVSRPSVTLFLKEAKDGEARPHRHDDWQGETRRSIGEATIVPACRHRTDCRESDPYFRFNPKAEASNAVLAGASVVEVTLAWDPAKLKADKLGLAVRAQPYNYSVFAPRGPGVPFRIQANWETTDIGHVRFSSWWFYWFVPLSEDLTWDEQQETRKDGYDWGTIQATGSIERGGRLPLEPGHPDQWRGRTVIQVTKAFKTGFDPGSDPPDQDLPCLGWTVQDTCREPSYPLWVFGTNLVPAGTQWMEVFVQQARPADPPFGLRIYYKTANTPPGTWNGETLANFKWVDPQPGGTLERTVYRFAVAPEEADFVYSPSSTWGLTFRPDDAEAAWEDHAKWDKTRGTPLAKVELTYTFDAFVHKDPM